MSPDLYDPKMPATRLKVDQLLNEASDLKMLRHYTKKAREKIEMAYQLAEKNNLPPPWPSLCAYRLGHLIMRTASDEDSLLDAEQYFMEAARAKSLGPLPALYRLAVLHRLKKMKAGVTGTKIEAAFAKAEEAIHEADVDNKAQIQDHLFNMLEMAAYFTAVDYSEVDGMGEYHGPEKHPHSWILVGPDPQMAEVKYSEAFALEELDALTKSHPKAVFFILRNLTSPKTGKGPPAQWKTGQKEWQKASYPGLRLLALRLKQTTRSIDGLMCQFLGESDFTPNAFNQNKVRLKRHLAELTGGEMDEILMETPEGNLEIKANMEIFGAVEESALFV